MEIPEIWDSSGKSGTVSKASMLSQVRGGRAAYWAGSYLPACLQGALHHSHSWPDCTLHPWVSRTPVIITNSQLRPASEIWGCPG